MADHITLEEVTGRGAIELRLRALDAATRKAVAGVVGAEPPARPRTSATSGDNTILWLSVDQWLITCPDSKAASLASALEQALAGQDAAIINVSDARRVIRVSGDKARLVLMKGTSVDLLHEDVTPGFVRRARFADLATLIHCVGDDAFDLYLFRSYHDYVRRWLDQTSRETSLFTLFGKQAAPAV